MCLENDHFEWENYGQSPFSMGKSTISTGPFSIAMAMFVYQRVGFVMVALCHHAMFEDIGG